MTFLDIMAFLIGGGIATSLFFFRKGGIYNPHETPVKPPTSTVTTTPALPYSPPVETAPKPDYSTPSAAFHSVRVLCDEMGLSYDEKNLICAVIYQESRFNNKALNKNPKSTDYGICQINDRYHIGPGKSFESVEYVLNNPDKIVAWMIRQYKLGNLRWWVAYSSGAYLQWLTPTSPMWSLRHAGKL